MWTSVRFVQSNSNVVGAFAIIGNNGQKSEVNVKH